MRKDSRVQLLVCAKETFDEVPADRTNTIRISKWDVEHGVEIIIRGVQQMQAECSRNAGE